MTRRACAAAHSRPLPRRLLTSALRSCQPAKPYSRAMTSCALRCVSGGSARGRCARARAIAAASPAAISRASFFACLRRDSREGRGGRDLEAVMAPPFMNRLCPAETRLKEGADAHVSEQTGGSVPLPRVGGALSARSRQYRVGVTLKSNTRRIEVKHAAKSGSRTSPRTVASGFSRKAVAVSRMILRRPRVTSKVRPRAHLRYALGS